MPTLRSSVLIVGDLKEKFSFDIDCVNSFQEAHCQLQNDSAAIYSVFILPAQNDSEELETFLRKIGKQSPDSQIILVANQIETHRVLEISNQYTIFKLVDSTQKSDLEKPIQEALEEFALIQQNNQLALLIQEQNEKLKHLHRELEDRVEKRQNFLNDARKKLLQTTERVHTLREALVAVHKASSLGELETLLNKVLSESLRLSWTRIFFHPQDNIFQNQKSLQLSFSLFQAPLFKGSEQIGSIYFLRKPEDPFSKNDTDFLLRVAEAVSLALDRLAKMEQSESLKQQWETTFNALSVPVSLIDEKYEIKQCNQSFLTASKKKWNQVIGQKCHKILFDRDTPCSNCHLGKKFQLGLHSSSKTLEVTSQTIQFHSKEPTLYLNIYRDITEQLKMEAQVLESAKMAELGTIGSSIAHELNNPLGGILSFAQLIKMDLDSKNELYPDITEIEQGALRCRDIVQNLLGFTRNPGLDEIEDLDLRDVVHRAAKIIELQTRSMGIELKIHTGSKALHFRGHKNLLSQAVKNLLQNSFTALSQEIRASKGFRGVIEVVLKEEAQDYVIEISDNGWAKPGLNLSIARQIIQEHKGNLTLISNAFNGSLARIRLPSLVFKN